MQFYADKFGWLNVQGTTTKGQTWTRILKISDNDFEYYYALFKHYLDQKKNEREEEQKKNRRED